MKTLKFQNKETKKYYKKIRSRFPLLGKQEKAFLIYLQEMLQEFETHHPDYKCDDYYEQFGIPETIIAAYYEHIESEFIIDHRDFSYYYFSFNSNIYHLYLLSCITGNTGESNHL